MLDAYYELNQQMNTSLSLAGSIIVFLLNRSITFQVAFTSQHGRKTLPTVAMRTTLNASDAGNAIYQGMKTQNHGGTSNLGTSSIIAMCVDMGMDQYISIPI